jgi:hypothetical protein
VQAATLLAILGLNAAAALGAEQWCMFEITVRTTGGAIAPGVPVVAFLSDGSVLAETISDSTGVARVCDAPWPSLIQVSVGPLGERACGQVRVRHLYPLWKTTRAVHVIYDACFLPEFYRPNRCNYVLRLDEGGQPLARALLRIRKLSSKDPLTRYDELHTDGYGRALIEMEREHTYEIVFVDSKVKPARLIRGCGRATSEFEERVRVSRATNATPLEQKD